VYACTKSAPAAGSDGASPLDQSNPELQRLFEEDQAQRSGRPEAIDWAVVGRADEARRKRADEIIASGGARSAEDFYRAAMLFQHGTLGSDFDRARELALTALRLDPYHEPSAQIAMKAAALEGDRGSAMEVFEALAAALREIGIEPGATTRELLLRIRAGRFVRGAAAEATPAEARPALAGSAGEVLRQLVRAWGDVVSGESRAWVIVGDPGTGKTRLADELASRALLDGAVVSRARAIEGEGARETLSALLRGGLETPEPLFLPLEQ